MATPKINWDALPTSDLEAIAANRWDDVSEPVLKLIAGEEYGTLETLGRSFERGVTSTLRGASQFFGNDLDYYNKQFDLKTDLEREKEYRTMLETNPVAAVTGVLAGSVADPTNLLPIGTAKTVKQFIGQGAAVGGVAGALEPTYTDEFQDSRVTNTIAGLAVGGVIGGAIGKLVEKFGPKITDDILATGDVSPDGKEITTPHFKLKLGDDGEWQRIEVEPTEALLKAREEAVARREVLPDQPITTIESPQAFVARSVDEETLPVLPQFLSGAKPKFAKSDIEFDTDLDKALYIVGNPTTKSAKHDDYMTFLRQSLGLPDNEILKIAHGVRKEVVQTGKVAQLDAGLGGVGGISNFKFGMSKALDAAINPVNKYLDDISKSVYNLGAGYRTGPKGYPVLTLKQAEEAVSVMQRVDPTFVRSMPDAARNVVAYRKYLDDMKTLKGRQFKAPSFEGFIKNGIDADDQIKMAEAGFFDGCR